MSQQPPPPPYGGPPAYPPYGGPPQQPPGQPSGMSNKAKFWIGVLLALPALVLSGILAGAASAIPGPDGSSTVGAISSSIVSLLLLALLIVGIVLPRTRWFAIGLLAGGAILFILAAGACVVLIVAFTNSYN